MAQVEFSSHRHPLHRRELSWESRVCGLCGKEVTNGPAYECSQCNFTAHPGCAENPPSLVIDKSKIHDHTLTLLPRDVSYVCNVCGLLCRYKSPYVCLKCCFMIHGDCIDTPRVIQISRHGHRLSHTCFLGLGEWFCGVCRRMIDGKYGAYRCDKGCSYAVHTRCATREDVWDGEELEGVPEEHQAIDERIVKELGDGLIRHFSHDEHVLRLENGDTRDVVCSGCSFPVASNPFYRCQQCDFFLHVPCANLPSKKISFLHKHPLTLCTEDDIERSGGPIIGLSRCSACEFHFNGFRYRCLQCKDDSIEFDVRCSSFSEPFYYPLHRHPFSFNLGSPIDPNYPSRCSFCSRDPLKYMSTCIECDDVALCSACATSPDEVIYKYDEHLLSHTIGEGDVATNPYWCDICQNEIQEKKHHYKCCDCGPVLHADCVLGSFRNLRPGFSFITPHGQQFEVIHNDRTLLLRCSQCHNDCHEPLLLMSTTTTTTNASNVTIYLCSSTCFDTYVSV